VWNARKANFLLVRVVWKCDKCPTGQHQSFAGRTACSLCQPGSYANNEGTIDCLPCAVGQFSEFMGNSTCTRCPKGSSQNVIGESSCKVCLPGRYSNSEGLVECKMCESGTYSNSSQCARNACLEASTRVLEWYLIVQLDVLGFFNLLCVSVNFDMMFDLNVCLPGIVPKLWSWNFFVTRSARLCEVL